MSDADILQHLNADAFPSISPPLTRVYIDFFRWDGPLAGDRHLLGGRTVPRGKEGTQLWGTVGHRPVFPQHQPLQVLDDLHFRESAGLTRSEVSDTFDVGIHDINATYTYYQRQSCFSPQ